MSAWEGSALQEAHEKAEKYRREREKHSEKKPGELPFKKENVGWECPKCGKTYAPHIPTCLKC